MKKLLCLLLALLMIASVALISCDEEEPIENDEPLYNEEDDLAFNPTLTTSDETTEEATTAAPTEYTFKDVNETVYVKNCLKVNLRKTPSSLSNENIAGSLEFGDERTYKRVKYNEVWSGLEIDGEIFYVNSEFLTTDDGFVVFEAAEKTIYAVNTVSSSGVFLYNFTDVDADGARWGTVAHGTPLQVTGVSKSGKWYRVSFTYTDDNGKEVTAKNLYIYNGKYVSDTEPTETAPVEE